jgi:F-type H+-transporting ATPase subunit b
MFLLAFAEPIQLFPDGTIFIHIGLILLMIWVLNRTFFRPIYRVIASREMQKGGRGSEADNILLEAGEKESKYNQELLEARSRGYEMIEQEQAEAAKAREDSLGAARREIETRLAAEKADLEKQKAEAKTVLEQQANEMADKISANILRG